MRRLLPALAIAQAAGILAADRGLVCVAAALGLGGGALALGVALPRARRARVACALVAAFAGGALALGLRHETADAPLRARRVERSVEATVREVARVTPSLARVDLGAVSGVDAHLPPPPRIRLWLPLDPARAPGLEAALPGERIRARVRIAAPASRRNPGAPDARARARRAGIGAVGSLVHPTLVVRVPEREGWRPLARVHALRARAAARLGGLGPGGELLRALALGQAGALDPALRDACAGLGISHLLAVSGLHLGLVAALAYWLARRSLARSTHLAARWDLRRLAFGLAFAGAAAYAALAGAGIPVRRALVLLGALVAAAIAGRPAAASGGLAAASLAILAAEPGALFDAGAQLSFAGSAALAAAVARAAPTEERRVRRVIAESLRVSATALLATAPIAAAHFGRSAPFALIANALAVPWTAVVLLPGALVAAALALLPAHPATDAPLAALAHLAAGSLRAALALADALPESSGAVPGPAWLGAAALVAAAGLRARHTAVRVALAIAMGGLLAVARPEGVEPEAPRVVFLDVGQGDAVLAQSADAAVLVDAGGSFAGAPDPGRATVVPALRALGVRRVDLLVVSHADLDHRGGAPAVLRALPVGAVWVPYGAGLDASFATLARAARTAGVPLVERGAGSLPWARGDLVATPLWPPRSVRTASRNDRSLVLRVEVAGRRILLPGDLEADGERSLLAAGADLRAEVLKLAHHGSRTSSTPEFLAAVGASVAVASAPCEGRFAMPHPEVARRARAHGAALWWTGRDGAVRIGLGARLHALGTGSALRCLPTAGERDQ